MLILIALGISQYKYLLKKSFIILEDKKDNRIGIMQRIYTNY